MDLTSVKSAELPFGVWLHLQRDRKDSVGDISNLFMNELGTTPMDVIDWAIQRQEDDKPGDKERRHSQALRVVTEWRHSLNGQQDHPLSDP